MKGIEQNIEKIEKYNPILNCFITVVKDPSLLKFKQGPLTGIPIAVKDNFCTAGIRTTAASKVLEDFIPPYDATVVKRLKNAGAVIIGKTNMDAWAHGSSTETSDFGTTRNPWDLNRVAGGSSGGSACAVSAGLVPLAIGSETAGSIRQPASWCGVVGLKPTYGRVSRYGLIAMCSSTDSPGILGSNITDITKTLQIIAGKDPFDATTADRAVPNYISLLGRKVRYIIGVSDEYLEGVEEDVLNRFEDVIEVFKKLGCKVKKIKTISPKYAISVYTIVQRAEVSSNLARYTGIRYGNNRSLFGSEAKKRIVLGTYTLCRGYYDEYYKRAQKVRRLLLEDFKKVFKEVDVILSPTTPTTALKVGESEKYPFFGELMDKLLEPSSLVGLPGINLPCGLDRNGLPIGFQIVAPWFEEGLILNLSYRFEKETEYFGVIKKGFERYR
uniref:Glutamyl-tRNA(Gln) amidotransferase subunit A n=1 Tax=candidate division CPR3 bacterium TaxID=2268181 RepID=A0A7C5YUN1_UNCC3